MYQKTQWTRTSRWCGPTNHHRLWKLHSGHLATWLCASPLFLQTQDLDFQMKSRIWFHLKPLDHNAAVQFLFCQPKSCDVVSGSGKALNWRCIEKPSVCIHMSSWNIINSPGLVALKTLILEKNKTYSVHRTRTYTQLVSMDTSLSSAECSLGYQLVLFPSDKGEYSSSFSQQHNGDSWCW